MKNAQTSIDLMTYGLSDPDILNMLDQKRGAGVQVLAICDKRSSPNHPGVTRVKKSGLHHAKLAIIDHHLTYLGSANFTTTSLELHHNSILGIDSFEVAAFFEKMLREGASGHTTWQNLDLFMLPEKTALASIVELIDQASKEIKVAMFTLSHPELIAALERAEKRHVRITLYVDRFTKQPKTTLKICHTKSPGLLHHKWALIDNEHLVIGSANWTKAAFGKNREVLAIVRNLSPAQQTACKKLWKAMK